MISYPVACPEACSLLREKCSELAIDEFYATSEDGRRYALLHLDRKVRMIAVERGVGMLASCGVHDVQVSGFDESSQSWFAILERHLNERDPRVVVWTEPGKTRSVLAAGVVHAASDAVEEGPMPKRLRSNGPIPTTAGVEELALRQLLVEKDRLLAERDASLELALAEKDRALERALAAKDEEARMLLLRRQEEDEKLLDAKEEELLALRAKVGQGDSVIVRMTADVARLQAAVVLASETEAELRKRRGDSTQREIELVVDLNAERSRVRDLLQHIDAADTRAAGSLKQAQLQTVQLRQRLSDLDGEVALMRKEAMIWEQDRERRRIEMGSMAAELSSARAAVCALNGRFKDEQAEVAALRRDARAAVRAELESESAGRLQTMRESVALVQQDGEFKNREWKRRTEALRDELAAVQQELARMGQRSMGVSSSTGTRSDVLSVTPALISAILGVVAGDDSAAATVCGCIRRLVLDVLGGTEDEVARLNKVCSTAASQVVERGEVVGRNRIATMDQVAPHFERLFNAIDLGYALDMQVLLACVVCASSVSDSLVFLSSLATPSCRLPCFRSARCFLGVRTTWCTWQYLLPGTAWSTPWISHRLCCFGVCLFLLSPTRRTTLSSSVGVRGPGCMAGCARLLSRGRCDGFFLVLANKTLGVLRVSPGHHATLCFPVHASGLRACVRRAVYRSY
jgi:hypothetical protein